MAVSEARKSAAVSPTRRRRSVAIALGLGALAVIFFAVTLVQMQGNVAKRMQQEGKSSNSTVLPQTPESGSGQ